MYVGNHSCSPNVEVVFPYNNSTLALRALTDIEPGEVMRRDSEQWLYRLKQLANE